MKNFFKNEVEDDIVIKSESNMKWLMLLLASASLVKD
jgi:hypothetical protein